jgi:hypothetical protein
MPNKTVTNKETVAATPVRAAKPKTTPVAQRAKSVKHSKATPIPVADIAPVSAHDQIAIIAYGYWAARGFQPGSPEQDWLRAEREFVLQA